jgi:PST family polysaccharide transporter
MNRLEDNRNTLLKGTLIITLTGLILKGLSVIYRIPYQNIAGDVGFYVLQQVYPIYALAVALCTYGFPVILSKIISEEDKPNIKNYFIGLSLISISIFTLGVAFSGQIANYMGDTNLQLPIRVSFIYFLFLPFLSLGRGYFQGKQNMAPTAMSQLVEQSLRVVLILVIAIIFIDLGFNPYFVGAGAVIGSIIAGLASCIILVHYFLKKSKITSDNKSKVSIYEILNFIKDGFFICISSLLLIIFQLIDSFTVLNGLLRIVADNMYAMSLKGVYDRGQPLIQVGTIIASSLALSIVPFLSDAKKQNNNNYILEKIRSSLKINIIIGAAASIGLFLIIKDTNIMLFENSKGTETLGILSFSIILSSIGITSSGILQGLGYIKRVALNCGYGFSSKLILNITLIDYYGVNGAAISTIMSLFLICVLNLILLNKEFKFVIQPYFIVKIAISLLAMVIFVLITKLVIDNIFTNESRIVSTITALSSVGIGVVSYIYFLVKQGVFNQDELQTIPKGVRLYEIIIGKKRL